MLGKVASSRIAFLLPLSLHPMRKIEYVLFVLVVVIAIMCSIELGKCCCADPSGNNR